MTLDGSTILVTGATGFLGGAMVRRLAAEGATVRALARNPDRAGYVRDVENVTVVEGDLTHPLGMVEVTAGCTHVVNVAAALNGSLATQMSVNHDGTRNVMTAAVRAGVERVVHISTIALYGYRNTTDVTEETPPQPGRDPYGVSKLAAERVVHEFGATRGLRYTIIRPGMIYGPRSGMWTGQMFKLARRNPTIFIGDGSGSCFPIHVDDVVDLTVTALTHPSADGETFNCTPDPSPTWREFLGGYAALAGHQNWLAIPPVLLKPVAWLGGKFAPADSALQDLPDLLPFSQRHITYKMDKAADLLGWRAGVPLDAGIAGTEDWLRDKGLL